MPVGMKTTEIYEDTRGVGKCSGRRCGRRIIWATLVKSGRKMCFDGPLVALRTRTEDSTRRTIEEVDLDSNHWANCPDADDFGSKRRGGM